MHAFVAFCPVMTKIKYMYTTKCAGTKCLKSVVNMRVCDHWACPINILDTESKRMNPYTNTTKTHSLF